MSDEYAEALEWFDEILGLIRQIMLEKSDLDVADDELIYIITIRKALTRPAIDCADMVRLQSIEEGLYSAYETGNPMLLWDYVEKLMEGGE